ncbi:hypothetical protein JH06_2350 [Blastocystis sp. subtype 4]|uniref:hypothetical protein n=1 Tax=Blastocystis sp. subtype 4 TaxID=944170 RepID=UPI000711FBBF|nr:hypothetical protein JH06_2350 [Blastocystis sp. subtype 4]KNB46664.1 hypothetical protein JH06_2350 [Blastocystis sp. subtype 4]|eukprot:XP_014530135.1 hypothetical protein JH06_2350 [Blastocystis sp. subtype 4]
MDLADLQIPDGLEDFDPAEFEKELAASNGDLSSSSSTDSSDESSSTDRSFVDDVFHEMTEEELIEARQQRYGRRRSQSIDYGSRGGGDHNFEQTPDQALHSRSIQILKTIPRFQYEALSWVPNLLKVQDTEQELNKEEEEEYDHDILPIEVDRVKYSNIVTYRIGIFGDVGVGKTTLLQALIKKVDPSSTLATNGVDYEEYYKIRDAVCHRFIFCDFSGQTRLYPILSGMEKEVLKNRLHEVYGCCGFGS